MAHRMKEDEKNEQIIRGLLKLPENRRCINCNSLGPQYVCTNFWTFVCTTCSGIHREFTHRVKSVSMANFTSQEVSALQGGGNEHAKTFYFKEWDSQRHSASDSSNVERLRDFIKHVYVDRRYTGERSLDKPPWVKMGDKEDSFKYHSGYGAPYEDTNERHYGDRSGPSGRNDERSLGYGQEFQKNGDYRKSPTSFEAVNDRHRDDRYGNRKFEDNRFSDKESKLEGRSQNQQKNLGSVSPPLVRPIRDILGDNIQPLWIGEPPKTNGVRDSDGSAKTQRTASSRSMESVDGNQLKYNMENSGSLINFGVDPEPPVSAAAPQMPQTLLSSSQFTTQAMIPSTDGGNWASFDFPSQEKVSQAPSKMNTLDPLISQLSVPAVASVGTTAMLPDSGVVFTACADSVSKSFVGNAPATVPVNNMPILPSVGSAPAPSAVPEGTSSMLPMSGGDAFIKANDVGWWPNARHSQHFLFPTSDSCSTTQQITQYMSGASNNQDPFAANYSPAPVPVPSWQAIPPSGLGFGMQHPSPRLQHSPTFPPSSKSTNPFDLSNEAYPIQAPMFPSMASLQGSLPNMSTPTGLLRTYSLGTPSAQWGPQSPSYASAMPLQSPSYASAVSPQSPSYPSAMSPRPPSFGMLPGAYMAQQIPSNLPPLGKF